MVRVGGKKARAWGKGTTCWEVTDLPGVLLPPPLSVTARLCLSPYTSFPGPSALIFPSPLGIFWLDWKERDRNLPVGRDVFFFFFFFFFFNKTEQNQKNPRQWCLVDLFIMQRQRVGRPVLLTAKGRPPKPPLPCSLSLRDVSVPRACAVCVQTLGGQIVASEGREGAGPAWLGQSYFWNQLGCEAGGGGFC